MKTITIYSKKIRNLLLDNKFNEVKEPERNIKFPKLLVFFFEDSPEIREFLNKNGVKI